MLPTELTQMIIGFVDTPSLLSTQSVCHLWMVLSIEERKRRLELWKPGEESKQLIRPFMTNPHFIANPRNLLWVCRVLASKTLLFPTLDPLTYYEGLYCYDDHRRLKVITEENLVPKVICEFASAIKTSPHLHGLLCRIYLNYIDVLDIHTTSLAAYIVNRVPEIQNILKKVSEKIAFEPVQFAELALDFENHHRLHQYFMALRLLTLSGYPDPEYQRGKVSDAVHKFLLYWDKKQTYESIGAHLIGHPFWGAYFPNLLNSQWNVINYSIRKGALNQNRFISLMDYTAIMSPDTAKSYRIKYLALLLELYERNGNKKDIFNMLSSMNTLTLKELANDNPYSAHQHIYHTGLYNLAMSILEEAHKRLEDDPVRSLIELSIAECILASKSEERFSQAEEYINKVLNHFQKIESGKIPNSSCNSSGGENTEGDKDMKLTRIANENFFPFKIYHRSAALQALAVLHIYQGRIQDAGDIIKEVCKSSTGLHGIIPIAIQRQLTDLSDNFISLVGETCFTLIFKANPYWKKGLEKDDMLTITRVASKFKWFFDAALDRGLLKRAVFDEIVAFCNTVS